MARELELNRYREMLQKERERMLHQMRMNEVPPDEDQADRLDELADYDDHPADVATDTFEREKDSALRASAREVVMRVDHALQKIERGSYGTCDICGADIPAGRLDAVPYATLCIKCQADMEGR